MRRLLLSLVALALASGALAQSDAITFYSPIRCGYAHDNAPENACLLASDLGGAYVKEVTAAGVVTVQLSDGTETTRTIAQRTAAQVRDLLAGLATGSKLPVAAGEGRATTLAGGATSGGALRPSTSKIKTAWCATSARPDSLMMSG